MMKILVTGAGGLLGQKLVRARRDGVRLFPSGRVRPPDAPGDFDLLDVTQRPQIEALIDRLRPDWVVHTAALTNVDRCEVARGEAWRVNVEGTENIAGACERRSIGLVSLSTDYVFDGASGPYAEDDPTNPLSYYGLTKLESERRVLSMGRLGGVVRTIVLFGYASSGRDNFVTWLIRSLRQGRPVRVVTDQWGTPTLADDLAGFLVDFCLGAASGLFHFAGADLMSRYDTAVRVCRAFGLDEGLVSPVTTQELGQVAPRPPRSGLKTDKVQRVFRVKPRPFEESLRLLLQQTDNLKALA